MDKPNNIYAKLQKVRADFSSEELKKSGRNDFSKYDYFELSDFIPIANIRFKEVGLCPVVTFPSREEAELTIYDSDNPDAFIVFHTPMGKSELKGANDCQNVGSAETYARRYLYMAALELTEHDAVEEASQVAEINETIKRITQLGAEITSADPTKRADVMSAIRGVLGHTKYQTLKAAQIDDARKITAKLEEMKDAMSTEGSN